MGKERPFGLTGGALFYVVDCRRAVCHREICRTGDIVRELSIFIIYSDFRA